MKVFVFALILSCSQFVSNIFNSFKVDHWLPVKVNKHLIDSIFSKFVLFTLFKVLGFSWFEIQNKLSVDYLTILGIFLIQTNTFIAYM